MSYIAKNGRLYTSGASEALTLLDDKFSVNKSYSKGDSCIYNDYLWKFTSDKPAGEWDSSVVEQCRIMDFVDDINDKLDNKNNFIIKASENEKLGSDVVIIKYNKMIQIRFNGFKNLTLNTYNTLFVLPDEFKPASGVFYDCIDSGGGIYRILIGLNGVVELFPYTNINLYNACNTFVYISN